MQTHLEPCTFRPGNFRHSTSRAQTTLENRDMTGLFDRVIQPPDNILIMKLKLGNILEVLGESFACDCHLRSIDEVRVLDEVFQKSRNTSNFVEVFHVVFA